VLDNRRILFTHFLVRELSPNMTTTSSSKPLTIWLTGLSGSGKSTIAEAISQHPVLAGSPVSVLDGDVLRTGLCKDLGFSMADRHENVRRVAEAAKLLNDAGVTVVCALISPLRSDRELARAVIGEHRFLEIFIAASLEACEQRDPKGLYKKARSGKLPMFTGISSAYEPPTTPTLLLDTDTLAVDDCVEQLANSIRSAVGERC
jgi:adenylylsulfate kinase